MTESAARLSARIESVQQLHTIVTGLRGIAAGRAQQARAKQPAAEAYADIMVGAIGEALALFQPPERPPAGNGRRAVVAFTAEVGFAGPFSERVFAQIEADPAEDMLFVVGGRGISLARERGEAVEFALPMATQPAGIPATAQAIAEALYARIEAGLIDRVALIHSRTDGHGGVEVQRRPLLPLDLGTFRHERRRQPPLTTLSPALLLERLTAEYVYACLCQAAISSLVAENEARILATTSAKSNVETTLSGLLGRFRQARQEAITAEVVELAAGADAGHRRPGNVAARSG